MCGRYSLFVPSADIEERFDVTVSDSYEPRYNAAPSQSLPVIPDIEPDRMQPMEWGLVPPWADSRGDGGHINARAETLTETASFSASAQRRSDSAGRCLVPADGFYEWVDQDGRNQPYRVERADGEPFAMAGLWAEFQPSTTQTGLDAFADGTKTDEPSEPVRTFTIVTTQPNDLVEQLHHRMSVILPETAEQRWLDGRFADVVDLLEPYPSSALEYYPVSDAVNDPANDSPAVVEPLEE